MAFPPGFIGSSGKHVIIGGSCYQFGGNEDINSLTIGWYSGEIIPDL